LRNSRGRFRTRFTHARHHHPYNLALRSAFRRVHCLGVDILRDPGRKTLPAFGNKAASWIARCSGSTGDRRNRIGLLVDMWFRRRGRVAASSDLSLNLKTAFQRQILLFADGEVISDRIERGDGSQRAAAGTDKIADLRLCDAGNAIDWNTSRMADKPRSKTTSSAST
jgi:hypothetical protein